MAEASLDIVGEQLANIIDNLYMLIVQAHDHRGQATSQDMIAEIKRLVGNLQAITQTSKRLPTHLPIEIIQYVENGRNPDIYTREFVELVMRYNQQQKGRSEAYGAFRDILGREMMGGIPEIRDEVKQVVLATGGTVE
ncbi:Mediator of RNA polymerase II transcription subunit 10 [Fulvia fulva]|nr:Mediator of RNA polymerase II transcription subunit 10 [Fulvia fulva]WPV09781.1 Mediator of RNA polymerase II transcription subunit 10 [Fulvia fulva]WPV24645.1 Mediator of RNA polymerase II transcription subunit 10 [Fulvia fulva]